MTFKMRASEDLVPAPRASKFASWYGGPRDAWESLEEPEERAKPPKNVAAIPLFSNPRCHVLFLAGYAGGSVGKVPY